MVSVARVALTSMAVSPSFGVAATFTFRRPVPVLHVLLPGDSSSGWNKKPLPDGASATVVEAVVSRA